MNSQQMLVAAALLGAGLGLTAQAADHNGAENKAKAAVAVLHGTQNDRDAQATIHFKPTGKGLAYTINAKGLKPGKHAYHIHFYGDCTAADGKSAGTHFNLQGSSHHPPKDIDRITGNLGDLDTDQDGKAHAKGVLQHGKLNGDKSIIGRSVIIHAQPNDPDEPPIGAAGARDACGVIGIAKAK
jgi:Cu-Zn family superoxide dismutase